ncbi:hypothetical protein BX589_1027 [Paraburkholderia fungorum]|jgi:hypothetical protein|nr:hypothetical protein BX589_1027 [Paraburkholderia fungorum]
MAYDNGCTEAEIFGYLRKLLDHFEADGDLDGAIRDLSALSSSYESVFGATGYESARAALHNLLRRTKS